MPWSKTSDTMVQDIVQQSAELAYKKAMLRIHRWNLDKDYRLAKILGIKEPKKLEWFFHQALQEQSSSYGRMVYPPDLHLSDEFNMDEEGWEPVGHYYNRYTRWLKVDNELSSMRPSQVSQTYSSHTRKSNCYW
jgi:hypothetical protein